MKVNSNKTHILMPGNKKAIANINNNCIESEDAHEFLGLSID